MNPSALFIGFAAGLTAALLFAGLALQSTTAIGLSLLAPIPLYIASLGWGSTSGAVAAATAAFAVWLGTGSIGSGLTMLTAMAGPAAYAGHLAGLSRPVSQATATSGGGALPPMPGAKAALEWFPLGRILFAIALCASGACLFIGWLIGFDPDELGPLIADALAQQGGTGMEDVSADRMAELSRLVVDLVPLVQPALLVVVLVATLHLAAVITRMSARLARPRDDIPAGIVLPKVAMAFFAAGIVGAFLPGTVGPIATVFAGGFGAAFTLVGLAGFHRRTRGRSARGLLLFAAYAAMIILSFPILIFTALGVFETTQAAAKPRQSS